MKCSAWRVALKGNTNRGINRALAMENLYGTADHLLFRSEEDAQKVVDALKASGHACHTVPPKDT